MKLCTTCKEVKELNEYSVNRKMKDGLSIYCKTCLKEYRKNRYSQNKSSVVKQQKENHGRYRQRNRNFVIEYLQNHPCVDCGETDIVVLEFDHVLGEKLHGVGHMIANGWSLETIKKEIAKCEVRCANDHRRVTAQRADWYRTL